jgi:hypothetical protein
MWGEVHFVLGGNMDLTHSTRIVPMRDNVFNLEKAAQELLAVLPSTARDITIFVCLDGFRILHLPNQVLRVCIGKENYPVIFEPTDSIHHSGDVRVKYNWD